MNNYVTIVNMSMIKESGTDEESEEYYQKEILRYFYQVVPQKRLILTETNINIIN